MSVKLMDSRQQVIELRKEVEDLREQLRLAKLSNDAIQAGDIDALVVGDTEKFKIYTENTSDKIYRILVERMYEGAVTLMSDGAVLYGNSAFANMVNIPLEKLIGTKFRTLIGFSRKKWDALVKQSRKKVMNEELLLLTPEGKTTPVLLSMNALSIDDQHVLSVVVTDLTIHNKNREELKDRTVQLEQKNVELENANKDLTAFTYVSSHDLQEPLRKIQNFVSCILHEDEGNLSETGKRYFEKISHATLRMRTLIQDLLVYSEAKNSERKFEVTDLEIIVDEVKKDLEDVIQETGATIETMPLCDANIIRSQFRQLFHNLISNSLKFVKPSTPPHIKIESEVIRWSKPNGLKLEPYKNYCHIIYTDSGIGFDPQYKDRIFEVFQRLHSQHEYKGTGIGLAICKRIVENHDGIIFASGQPNVGARFDIYIQA
ncbi:MAG TPA: ATP-binding protein [Chryseolinea sp.]